ncbi:hypothetical protein Hanom_Chr10g00904061 [Helianthus anomalus]
MVFLASVLESYESLIAGKVGNPKMTKEYYDQIDPEEMDVTTRISNLFCVTLHAYVNLVIIWMLC